MKTKENYIEVKCKWSSGYTTIRFYRKTSLHCPHCGQQEIWIEAGDGDYYVGPGIICAQCTGSFALPEPPSRIDYVGQDIARQLKASEEK